VGAAVVTGAGLAYYVYQKRARSGASYLDVIKQLPGEVQRVSAEARQRAADAVERGKAAARRRDAELALQLEGAGSRPGAAATPTAFSAPSPPATTSVVPPVGASAVVAPDAAASATPPAVAPDAAAPATPPAAAPGPDAA
jgi:hypothetical protein